MSGKRKAEDDPQYLFPNDVTPQQQVLDGVGVPGLVNEVTDFLNNVPLHKRNETCTPTPRVYKTLNPSNAPCPYEAQTQEGRCCVSRTHRDPQYQLTSSEQFLKVIAKALQFSQSGPVHTIDPRYRDVLEYVRNMPLSNFDGYCEIDYREPWALDALKFLCLFYSKVDAYPARHFGSEYNEIFKTGMIWRCYTSNDNFSRFVEIVNTCSKKSWHTWIFQFDVFGKSGPDSVFYFPIVPAHGVCTRIVLPPSSMVQPPVDEWTYTTLDSFATMVLHPKFIFKPNEHTILRLGNIYVMVPTTPAPGCTQGSRYASTPLSHMGSFLRQVANKLTKSDKSSKIKFWFVVAPQKDKLTRTKESQLLGSETFYNTYQIPVDLESLPPAILLDHMRAGFGLPTKYSEVDQHTATSDRDEFTYTPTGFNGLVNVELFLTTLRDDEFGRYKVSCNMSLQSLPET